MNLERLYLREERRYLRLQIADTRCRSDKRGGYESYAYACEHDLGIHKKMRYAGIE